MDSVETEFAKWLATLGVGGAIAALTLIFYNQLSKRHEEFIKHYTEMFKSMNDQLLVVIKENTTSNTRLIQMLETQERNALRKEDIVSLMQRIQEK